MTSPTKQSNQTDGQETMQTARRLRGADAETIRSVRILTGRLLGGPRQTEYYGAILAVFVNGGKNAWVAALLLV